MNEDNQFGSCGRTPLWIDDHILHRAGLRRDFKCKTEKSHFKIKFYSPRMQTILNSFIHSTVYQDNLKKDNTIPENFHIPATEMPF